MYFLRALEVELKFLKFCRVIVTEFTYLQSMKFEHFEKTGDIQNQVLLSSPGFPEQLISELPKEDINKILTAVKEVNKPIEIPIEEENEEDKKKPKFTFDEAVESLAERWGKTPLEIAEKFSINQINHWCNLIVKKEKKSDTDNPDKGERKTSADMDSMIKKLQQDPDYQKNINRNPPKFIKPPIDKIGNNEQPWNMM